MKTLAERAEQVDKLLDKAIADANYIGDQVEATARVANLAQALAALDESSRAQALPNSARSAEVRVHTELAAECRDRAKEANVAPGKVARAHGYDDLADALDLADAYGSKTLSLAAALSESP